MTSAATDLDLASIIGDQMRCRRKGCQAHANVYLLALHCRCSMPLCRPCACRAVERLAAGRLLGRRFRCSCGAIVTGSDMVPIQ